MFSFKALGYSIIAAMLVGANAYAANCDNIPLPCNDDGYNACMGELVPLVCPKGTEDKCKAAGTIGLPHGICACANLLNKEDKDKRCKNIETPAVFKTHFGNRQPSASQENQSTHTDVYSKNCGNFPVPCNDEPYQACIKELVPLICPNDAENKCQTSGVITLPQMTCACANLVNKEDKDKMCKYVMTPADFKTSFNQSHNKPDKNKPLYCEGYVQSPCDEEKFKACVSDFMTTFCQKSDCEVIGMSMYQSCACDNLLNQADRNLTMRCKYSPPPAQLKADLQKLYDDVKTRANKAAARNGSAAPMLPRSSVPISISPEQEKKYQPVCIENLTQMGKDPQQYMTRDPAYLKECMAYYAISDIPLSPDQDKKYRPMCLEYLRQIAVTFGKDPQQVAAENQLYLRHCMGDLVIHEPANK